MRADGRMVEPYIREEIMGCAELRTRFMTAREVTAEIGAPAGSVDAVRNHLNALVATGVATHGPPRETGHRPAKTYGIAPERA